MLSKPNRLPAKAFSKINSRGDKIWGDYLFCQYMPIPSPAPPQFGLIVSTKVSKKAVDRNRIRRLISENIRLKIKDIHCSVQAVIIAKRESIDKDYHILGRDIDKFIKKINQSCPKK